MKREIDVYNRLNELKKILPLLSDRNEIEKCKALIAELQWVLRNEDE